MDSLDKKAFELFSGRVVPKGATKKIKNSANVPTYVLEYLLGTYCTSDDEKSKKALNRLNVFCPTITFALTKRKRLKRKSRKTAIIPLLIS